MKKELNVIIKMLMLLVKALFMIGKSIVKIIYLIIKFIDNLIAKLFMKNFKKPLTNGAKSGKFVSVIST